ncbi:MAG: HDOD domain-containing protein [Lentisphaerae bacterium]|nr:HDOD domain-containing protein [Lentisphaerota bacterium]
MTPALTNMESQVSFDTVIETMPVFSPIVGKLKLVLQKSETSSSEIRELVRIDPILTAKVMKLVNSAFFALPQPIASLDQALALIGINHLKTLIITRAVMDAAAIRASESPLDLKEFWRHSLATALACSSLAPSMPVTADNVELFFTAGLLHDIGKIAMIKAMPFEYAQALSESHAMEVSLSFAELAHFGFTHADIGAQLARKWNMSESMTSLIEGHHVANPAAFQDPRQNILLMANNLVKQLGLGHSGNCVVDEAAEIAAIRLGLQQTVIRTMWEQLPTELQKIEVFLESDVAAPTAPSADASANPDRAPGELIRGGLSA